ncbi:agamous-like MADS-box protein AGL80 [Chenopodium quinoa]|uniref:MADS-box domain-containing protein n=1 Tax=Chenopodium quinoa TaxID=63459 RepID=A0A803M5E1_CHEQI|nr:agamous-like MADS-box protein AGL80 [Chenopodium quinoa]
MSRKNVKSSIIKDVTSRKASHKTRSLGLLKKTQEISVLCDVDACAIIYGEDDQVPLAWPSSEAEVRRIINNYKGKSQVGQLERQLDQQTFLKQTVQKSEEKLARIQVKNRELQMENIITDIMAGRSTLEQVPFCDLGYMIRMLKERMKLVKNRISNWGNNINSNPPFQNSSASRDDNLKINSSLFHGDGMMEAITSRNNHTSE